MKHQDMTMSEVIARFEHGREIYINVLRKVTRSSFAVKQVGWLGYSQPMALNMDGDFYTNHGHRIDPLFLSNDEGKIAAKARRDAHEMDVNRAKSDYEAAQRNFTTHQMKVSDTQRLLTHYQKNLEYVTADMIRATIAYHQSRIRAMEAKKRRFPSAGIDYTLDTLRAEIANLRSQLP